MANKFLQGIDPKVVNSLFTKIIEHSFMVERCEFGPFSTRASDDLARNTGQQAN
jgi:hypothetical protein